MQRVFYPTVRGESGLPLYVTGIGIDFDQKEADMLCLNNMTLLISASGRGKVVVGDNEYMMSTGDVVFVNRNITYSLKPVTMNWSIDWMLFDYGMSELPDVLFTSGDVHFWELGARNRYASVMHSVYDALTNEEKYGGFMASAEVYSLVISLNRETSYVPAAEHKNPAVIAAVNYINEHYTDEITLEVLCKAAGGLSEQYLCRLFKQETSMRPIEYVLRKRIAVARSFLEKTDLPIPEIAVKTGFRNTSYFYRNFKKFTGTSPLNCRQQAVRNEFPE